MNTSTPLRLMIIGMIASFSTMLGVTFITDIDSNYDLFFETNTFVIVLYICTFARKVIQRNSKLLYGAWMLLFNKAYDVLTEIKYLDNLADQYEFIDTFLEDGLLQVSFLLIAIGVTEITLKLKRQNLIDELTGLYNRKKLSEVELEEFDLIYLDINGLKSVNDRKGHHVGDLMLIRFSQVLKQSLVDGEMAVRLGGDEFAILTQSSRSSKCIEQIHTLLEDEKITFSYGIEPTTLSDLQSALEKSDKAMYKMKKNRQGQ